MGIRLKPRTSLTVRPDRNGEYPDAIALRLIRAGLAVPDLSEPVVEYAEGYGPGVERRGKKRRGKR